MAVYLVDRDTQKMKLGGPWGEATVSAVIKCHVH